MGEGGGGEPDMVTVRIDSSRCAGPATAGVDGGLRSTGLGGRSWAGCKRDPEDGPGWIVGVFEGRMSEEIRVLRGVEAR